MNSQIYDFVVVGSGLAGSTAAYLLSQLGEVSLISKVPLSNSNSYAAQGGVAAAIGDTDEPILHEKDTICAGNDLCSPDAVSLLTRRAPELMHWLSDLGVPFDRTPSGTLALGLEGAHSRPRILHAGGDATGKEIMETMTQAVTMCPNVNRVTEMNVVSLIRNSCGQVIGILGWNPSSQSYQLVYARRATILATGGIGQLYRYTTNPLGATGDGIALAYTAGARMRNLEFVQFHPTALDINANPHFLISEAVRGAGATLVDDCARPVMTFHPQKDLAPRDVVARTIYLHMQSKGKVYLDARNIRDFPNRFPTIYEHCVRNGIHPLHDLLPVTPAAHFMMGGVAASMSGETTVPGLFAIGEIANTGVHGANRLASNSLLECLVMAFEAFKKLEKEDSGNHRLDIPMGSSIEEAVNTRLSMDADEVMSALQDLMWQRCGIVRSASLIHSGLEQLHVLQEMHPRSPAILSSALIMKSALRREESRGAHYRIDFPDINPLLNHSDTVFIPTSDLLSAMNA